MNPGWYPDPDDTNARRYWDGEQWSAPLPIDQGQVEPAAPVASESSRKRPWKLIIAATVVVVLAAGAAVYWFAIRDTGFTVRGSVSLTGQQGEQYIVGNRQAEGSAPCAGTGGYNDIVEGAGVLVTVNGSTVAKGELDEGISIAEDSTVCVFNFTVSDVPDDADFYNVTVGSRDGVEYDRSELKDGPSLTIGQ